MEIYEKCVQCKGIITISVTKEQWKEYILPASQRRNIQDIFPQLTLGEREILLSGLCEECFKGLFQVECEECNNEGYTEETCVYCSGSGEGFHDGSTCFSCKGSGVTKIICSCDAGRELLERSRK